MKATAVVMVVLAAAAVLLAHLLSLHAKSTLGAKLDRRISSAGLALGLSVDYDGITLNPITGLALRGVSVSTITSEGLRPLMTAKSVGLMHSLHFTPEFHVRIDGVRIVSPRVSISVGANGSTNFQAVLANILKGDVAAGRDADGLKTPAGDVGVPVEVSEVLELVWKRGRLDISDARMGREGRPNKIGLHRISGRLDYDRRTRDISFETDARIEGNEGRIEIEAERKAGDYKIALRAEDVGLKGLSAYIPSFAVPRNNAAADLKLIAESVDGGGLWGAEFMLDVGDISFDHWRLADRVVGDIELKLLGELRFFAEDRRIEFERMSIGTDGIFLHASGHAEFADGFILDTRIESGRIPIQKALDAIPSGFIPKLRGAKVGGTIEVGLDFAIDTNRLGALEFEPTIEVEDFELIKAPPEIDIERLARPFVHKVRKDGEVVKEFLVGHPNYWFVPYIRLGENTKKGVLTCEDGSFFHHEGFRAKHFRESIIQDIRERRFARGASTITMQTAKNLFLSGKKNLSRKFQEILIAYAMEQMLSKERILEIYMNIIEWGPDIYGVGQAAKHYFDKWPKDLDPLEAAFLGSIIPTARRSHYMYTQGHVPDQWATYLALIVSKMGITGEEYAALEPFQPEFGWVRRKRLAEEKKAESKPEAVNP